MQNEVFTSKSVVMEKQIKYNIEGKDYILFSIPVKTEYTANRIYKKIKNTDSILRGSENVTQGTFWNTAIITISVLVPESAVKEFSTYLLNL